MRIHRRSISSVEYLKVGVEPAKSADKVDITLAAVKVAVVLDGVHPGSGDFHTAAWETIDGLNYATILMGPGQVLELAATDEVYIPWVQVADGVQVIEVRCFEDIVEVY